MVTLFHVKNEYCVVWFICLGYERQCSNELHKNN